METFHEILFLEVPSSKKRTTEWTKTSAGTFGQDFPAERIGTDLNLDEWIRSWGGSVREVDPFPEECFGREFFGLDQLRADGPLIHT